MNAATKKEFVSQIEREIANECEIPPFGWRCTRGKGHEGPCAAVEAPEDVSGVARAMQRLRDEVPLAATQAQAYVSGVATITIPNLTKEQADAIVSAINQRATQAQAGGDHVADAGNMVPPPAA